MPVLALFLFGPPRVEIDGTSISFDTRSAQALYAYLATTRQPHSRDSLAALLWPEYDQSHARSALRRTLSTLNKALQGEWLNVDREIIGLNFLPDPQIGVELFGRLIAECKTHGHPEHETCTACEQPLTLAVSLYKNDFLAGFSLRDSPEFDDWQLEQADALRRAFAGVLEALTHCHSEAHHFDSAILYARRWLAFRYLWNHHLFANLPLPARVHASSTPTDEVDYLRVDGGNGSCQWHLSHR